jgi:S1-C subfamily serine protease
MQGYDAMKYAGLLFATVGGMVLAQTAACEGQYIGNGEPLPIGNERLSEVASPELYDLDGLTNGTLKRALADHYEDRALLTTRGRHDSEIYKAISPNVVIIVTENSLGSGSYVSSDKILTNWHVIKGSQSVGIFFKPQIEGDKPSENSLLVARVVKIDPTLDLALLQLSNPPQNLQPIKLASESDIQIGADVHAIGHPSGKAWTYTKGIISQYRKGFEWKTEEGAHKASVIQTQTPINPGNSGGPLITDDGKLIGVNSFKSAGEGLNFAVSIVDVNAFLQTVGVQQIKRPSTCQTVKIYDGRDSQNVARLVQFDTNCDGKADYSFVTPDSTAKPISAHIDSNFDGRTDISVEDRNRDGRWDISFHDLDFDGLVDAVGYHPDGKMTPSRFEKYVTTAKY